MADFKINEQPEDDLNINGYDPLSVRFTDISQGQVISRKWDFGDGTTSTLQNPTHTFTNKPPLSRNGYTVKLTVTDHFGRSSTQTGAVGVITDSNPKLSVINSTGTAPLTVTFTGTTQPEGYEIVTCQWDFGDNSPIEYWYYTGGVWRKYDPDEEQADPPFVRQHTYTSEGYYEAKFTVQTNWGDGGEYYTATRGINVMPGLHDDIHADFTVEGPLVRNKPAVVQFVDQSTVTTPGNRITRWYWDFGDDTPIVTDDPNPTHIYNHEDKFTVKLTVFDTTGYSNTVTKEQYIQVDGGIPYVIEPIEYSANPATMGRKYTIKINVQNPHEYEAPVSIKCEEVHNPDDTSKQGSDLDPPISEKSINVPQETNGAISFSYLHEWRWMKKWEDGVKAQGGFESITAAKILIDTLTKENPSIVDPVKTLREGQDIVIKVSEAQPLHYETYQLSSPQYPLAHLVSEITIPVKVKHEKIDSVVSYWQLMPLTTASSAAAIRATPVPELAILLGAGEIEGFNQAQSALKYAFDPDPFYKEVAIKKDFHNPEYSEIPEIPSKQYIRDSEDLTEDLDVYVTTMIRRDAAFAAEDQEWVLIHQKMAAMYTKRITSDCSRLKQSSTILVNDLKAHNISFKEGDVPTLKRELIQNGLPDIEVRYFKRMGYSDDQIQEIANGTAALVSPDYLVNFDTRIIETYDQLEGIYYNQSIEFESDVANSSISTNIKLDPDVFDRNGNSSYLNAYVEIPNMDVHQINISTTKLNGIPALNDTSYSFVANPEILDRDSDGNPEIKIVFDKESIQSILVKGENEATVTGKIDEMFFVGTGMIAVYTTSSPTTGFSTNITSGNAPMTAGFTSTCSGYPDIWMWDFGDGEFSYDRNPIHLYNTKGTYNVSLKVMNDNGIYSEDKTNYIHVLTSITPMANFTAESTSVTKPIIMNFTDQSANNPTKWLWEFGDGENSTERNPSHAYPTAGNYSVMLQVKNNFGEDSEFRLLTIPEITNLPVANFTASEVSGKAPLTVAFNETSVNATSWSWDLGDGTISTERNPVIMYSLAGNYTVKLMVSNANGSDTLIAPDFITVIQPAPPVANFSANPRSGTAPLTVSFNDTSDGDTITLWYWQFGDGTTSTTRNRVHTYQQAGNYTVSFEIANSVESNTTTRMDYINVHTPPVTTIPTTVPTTSVTTVPTTTKPTPTKTHAPLSPIIAISAIVGVGQLICYLRKRNDR